MNRDKQINEMAKVICNCYDNGICNIDEKPCDYECGSKQNAYELYNAGYRKISDDHQRQCTCYDLGCQMAEGLEKKVAAEIFEEIEKLAFEVTTHGHFYALGIGYGTFSELKKKYTEGER